jgi:hypothetical protein
MIYHRADVNHYRAHSDEMTGRGASSGAGTWRSPIPDRRDFISQPFVEGDAALKSWAGELQG